MARTFNDAYKQLAAKHPEGPTYILGHSMGAALAQLCALDFATLHVSGLSAAVPGGGGAAAGGQLAALGLRASRAAGWGQVARQPGSAPGVRRQGVRAACRSVPQQHAQLKQPSRRHWQGSCADCAPPPPPPRSRAQGAKDLRVYTFGSPRVGNSVFAQFFEQLVAESWRFTHGRWAAAAAAWAAWFASSAHPPDGSWA